MIADHIKSLGGKEEATIIRYKIKTTCENATWANTTMARSLELDDIRWHCHPGAAIVLSAIATVKKWERPGKT